LDDELIQLIKEELNIKNVEFAKGEDELSVKLDTKITPQLKAEGEARELVRQIQELRKKKDCQLDEEIKVTLPKLPKEKRLVDYIKQKTLAKEILAGKKLEIGRVR